MSHLEQSGHKAMPKYSVTDFTSTCTNNMESQTESQMGEITDGRNHKQNHRWNHKRAVATLNAPP